MVQPSTPTKGDGGLITILRNLCTNWHLRLPIRDEPHSPAQIRRKDAVEELIVHWIRYLYFRDKAVQGALQYAIDHFEEGARLASTNWVYKPLGETDTVPWRKSDQITHKQTAFRSPPDESSVKELTESLYFCVSQVGELVKAKKNYKVLGAIPATIHIEDPISTSAVPQTSRSATKQSTLVKWLENRSTTSPTPKPQNPSADEFDLDLEALDDFEDVEMIEAATGRSSSTSRAINRGQVPKTPSDENFQTPPPTPPRKNENSGLKIKIVDDNTPEPLRSQQPLGPPPGRKRICPEPGKPSLKRKVSRDTARRQTAETSNKYPTIDLQLGVRSLETGAAPPPSFTERGTVQNSLASSRSNSLSLSRSLEEAPSVSSSMTTNSRSLTSANTSFNIDSAATSFDSISEVKDSTEHGPFRSFEQSNPGDSLIGESKHLDRGRLVASKTIGDIMDLDSRDSTEGEKNNTMSTNLKLLPDLANKPSPYTDGRLLQLSKSNSPFNLFFSLDYWAAPFRQRYELYRVSLACNLLSSASRYFDQVFDSYDSLWSSISTIVTKNGGHMPERSSSSAWENAGQAFEGVVLSGRLTFRMQAGGPLFEFKLNPLKVEPSYRFSRKFGNDRFCVISVPGLDSRHLPAYVRTDCIAARDTIITWLVEEEHHFLGRTWRAFFVKPVESAKKALKNNRTDFNEPRHKVYFFAEDGKQFQAKSAGSELDPRKHVRKTVGEMIEWFMAFKLNQCQSSLKLFARLALGVSNTTPTIDFKPREIIRSDDAYADIPCERRISLSRSDEKKRHHKPPVAKGPVMNDGCARMSKAAACAIAHALGMDQMPSIFQGRIGGAKGVWMVDALGEQPFNSGSRQDFWIEITDSQLKFEPHPQDAMFPDTARVTFEVIKYSKKLSATTLSFQLMPILEDRGVPYEVLKRLLEEDLTARVGELEVAMDSTLALRKWNQEVNPVFEERLRNGGIEMAGGMPDSVPERINWFVEHGFEPKSCFYLKELLYKAVHTYCLRLENKMNIGLGRSTNAYMIADPLAILEPNEIHIGFSTSFRDTKSGFDETMLHDISVLVARLPAHLPSDIQKVRAIFKPELRCYRDVVVFSSKGETSLASKLSGGDYDGDRAWICWEPDIVTPFTNASLPEFPPIEFYGIEKDRTKVSDLLQHKDYMNQFLRHAFNFNMQPSLLGSCTTYYEALCYHQRSINTPQARNIAVLLGKLVDSAKGGFKFDDASWTAYLKREGLDKRLPTPAYKDRDKAKPTDHMIDRLVFEVAKNVRQKALGSFDKHFQDVSKWDEDLICLRNELVTDSKIDDSTGLVLKSLEVDLEAIANYWMHNVQPGKDVEDSRPAQKSNMPSFRAIVDKCRVDFLAINPATPQGIANDADSNTKLWERPLAHSKTSHWDLLKASVAFHLYYKRNFKFVWHIAGVELGEIKAMAKGRGTYRVVTNEMFEAFKLDRRLVDGSRERDMELEKAEQPREAEEEDDDDEFNDSIWDDEMDLDF